MKKVIPISIVCLAAGILLGFSFNVTAEESKIPHWIKNTARFWADGQISDTEFISALQWLVNQKILVVPTDKTVQQNVAIQSSTITTNNNFITNTDFHLIKAEPEKYRERWAQFRGEISRNPEVNLGIASVLLNLNQGEEYDFEKIIWVIVPKENIAKYKQGKCLLAEGKVQGSVEGENLFGGTVSNVWMNGEKIQEISCLEAKYPSTVSKVIDMSQVLGNVKITINKVEFSEFHTRVYISVENLADSEDLTFLEYNAKIIQDKRQFDPTYAPFGLSTETIQTTILPETLSEGIIFFKPIEPKSFQLYLEGWEGTILEPWKFIFNVNF